jgi:hypothetical protein
MLLKIHKGWLPFKGIIGEDELVDIRFLINNGLIEENKKYRKSLDFRYSTTTDGERRARLALLSF